MPVSTLCQGIFIVSLPSTPPSMQKVLCNQAPSPISGPQVLPSSKANPFAVRLPSWINSHFPVESSCLPARGLPPAEATVPENAESERLQSLPDAQWEEFGMVPRRVLSICLLFSASVMAASASAVTEKKSKGKKSPFNEQRLLEQNKRMQALNNAPADFPGFVREGYNVKLVTTDSYVTCKSGLVYLEMQEGQGDYPKDGQQVIFQYVGYNESGRMVDSTFQQGRPAKTRLGINAMIPGFEEGLRTMKPGGKRRLIIPPELGPPVGPSTFFSAKQFEVFDVELIAAKDCTRRTIGFYSDYVCD